MNQTAEPLKDALNEVVARHIQKASSNISAESLDLQQVIQDIAWDYIGVLAAQGIHIPQSVKDMFLIDIQDEIQRIIVSVVNIPTPEAEAEAESESDSDGFRKAN